MPPLLTTTETAQRLGLTREQVLRRIGRGEIAAQCVGGRWLIDARSVDEYLARRRVQIRPDGAAEVGD